MKRGFDSSAYIEAQTAEILKRVKEFDRLYLEFGGKLCYDGHASRVLPGYKKTTKVELLKKLGELKIIYCINARDLQSSRVLGKSELTYRKQALKDLRDIRKFKLENDVVVITRFSGEGEALKFGERLKKMGKKVYFFDEIKNYSNVSSTLKGYKKHPYIPILENLIVVTGPAGGSGKMSVVLSQIYHEDLNGMRSGFAKFETFPIWNLPLNHPVNLAYEAATADLQDKNMIDPFHLKAYGKKAVNYNRDVENFSILRGMARKITKERFPYGYRSPTDMGVNMAKVGIVDDGACRVAAVKEIRRRDRVYRKEFRKGREDEGTVLRMGEIMLGIRD